MMMAEHKKRCTRISKAQKEQLVEFMLQNKPFARGQFSEFNANSSNSNTWELISSKLNSQGSVQKTVDQWKKCWIDMKSSAKKQTSDLRTFMNKTGGGSIADGPRPLSDLEEKIIAIITLDAVDGDGSTPELGRPVIDEILEKENLPEENSQREILEPSSSGNMPGPTKTKKKVPNRIPSYLSALKEARALQDKMESRLKKIEEQNCAIIAQNQEILGRSALILELLGALQAD